MANFEFLMKDKNATNWITLPYLVASISADKKITLAGVHVVSAIVSKILVWELVHEVEVNTGQVFVK